MSATPVATIFYNSHGPLMSESVATLVIPAYRWLKRNPSLLVYKRPSNPNRLTLVLLSLGARCNLSLSLHPLADASSISHAGTSTSTSLSVSLYHSSNGSANISMSVAIILHSSDGQPTLLLQCYTVAMHR
jgi:hypothetical protein